MAQGRMQLAMKETEARKGRDIEAIRWLIDNMTEDAEMERLLSAIPGSFNTDWGMGVWNEGGKHKQDGRDDRSQDEPPQAGPPVDTMVWTAQAPRPLDRPPPFQSLLTLFCQISHCPQ